MNPILTNLINYERTSLITGLDLALYQLTMSNGKSLVLANLEDRNLLVAFLSRLSWTSASLSRHRYVSKYATITIKFNFDNSRLCGEEADNLFILDPDIITEDVYNSLAAIIMDKPKARIYIKE